MIERREVEVAQKAVYFGSLTADFGVPWRSFHRPIVHFQRTPVRGGVDQKSAYCIQREGVIRALQHCGIGRRKGVAPPAKRQETLGFLQETRHVGWISEQAFFNQV